MTDIRAIHGARNTSRGSTVVWGIQILLALLFLFAGGIKLAMPAATLAQVSGLPGAFMKFIGLAEVAGALGLVLPGLLRVRRGLTPLAAVGLVTIMSGATVVTAEAGSAAGALMPLVVGVLAGFLARRRWNWIAPAPDARRAAEPSPRRAAARTRPAEAA